MSQAGKHAIFHSQAEQRAARTALQSADNAVKFISTKKMDSFESLAKFTADKEQRFRQLEAVRLSKGQKLSRLKELSKIYALYEPYRTTYKESQALKGIAKMKYDREHKGSLERCPEIRERVQSLLEQGEKITPKQWKAKIQSLQSEYESIGKERSKTATELAYAEVISYNKKNLERELQNESRQHDLNGFMLKNSIMYSAILASLVIILLVYPTYPVSLENKYDSKKCRLITRIIAVVEIIFSFLIHTTFQ